MLLWMRQRDDEADDSGTHKGWRNQGAREPTFATVHNVRRNRWQMSRQRRSSGEEHALDNAARVLRRSGKPSVVLDEERMLRLIEKAEHVTVASERTS